MILDSIIDSLLLLTNSCYKVLLFLFSFDSVNAKKHGKNNS